MKSSRKRLTTPAVQKKYRQARTKEVTPEESLRESEERWKFALEGAGDGVWDWNVPENHVVFSRQWKAMLGYKEHEVGEGYREWEKRVHPEDLQGALEKVRAHLEGRTPVYVNEFRMRCKDGSWKWILARGMVTSRDARGRPLRIIGTHADINERKAARERESRNLALVASGAPLPEILNAIITGVEAEHPAMRCCVMLVNPATGESLCAAAPSLPAAYRKKLESAKTAPACSCSAKALRTRQRVVIEDTLARKSRKTRCDIAHEAGFRSCWAQPILGGIGQVLGAFVCHQHQPHIPSVDEVGSISAAAHLVAVAVERVRRDEALRESEERHRFLADNTDDIVILSDAAGEALYISPSFFRKTGWSRKRVESDGWTACVHPDDEAAVEECRRENLRGNETTKEWRLRGRDDRWLWIESHSKPIRDPDGKVWRLLMSAHDITKRKQAEHDYQRELEFNRVLVNHTSAIIIVMDDQGRVQHLNPAAVREMGFKPEEVIGLTPWDSGLLSPEESQRTRERYARLVTGEHIPAYEVRVLARDGIMHTIEINSSCTWKANGGVDRVIVTGTDITERNRLQSEILKISEQEHARIGNDLHDGVGQMLTGIAALIEAMELELTGEQKESAGRIRHLMREAIQEVRRMSHGLSPAGVKHRGLSGALQLLAETVRTNHRTECDCEIDPEISIGDAEKETHLYRIAQEGVNNALRHGRPTRLRILLKRVSEGEAVLQIEDDGSGFKKSTRRGHNGIGVRVMDYRANLIGGGLQIQTGAQKQRGVRLVCRFPCARS